MLCRDQVAQLCDREREIREAGADLVVIGSGTPEQAGWFAEDLGRPVRVLADPDLATFRAAGARRGVASSAHPGMLLAAWRAWRNGRRQRGTLGDPLQQGAVWVVRRGGEPVWRYVSRFAGDHPDAAEVVAACRRAAEA